MRLRAPLLLLVLATIAPVSARACGVCLDSFLLQWSWLTTGVHFVTAVLFVELIVYGILGRVLKQRHRGRARWVLLGLGLGIALGVFSGGSGFVLASGFGIGLSVRFGLSVREGLGMAPKLAWARVGAVVLLVALGVLSVRPAARSTSWLISMVDGTLHRQDTPAHLIPRSWSERELRERDDAPALLLNRLSNFEPGLSEYDRGRGKILRLLRAHTMVSGDATQRHAECRRLDVDSSWGELMQSAHAARICGPETEPIAAARLP